MSASRLPMRLQSERINEGNSGKRVLWRVKTMAKRQTGIAAILRKKASRTHPARAPRFLPHLTQSRIGHGPNACHSARDRMNTDENETGRRGVCTCAHA